MKKKIAFKLPTQEELLMLYKQEYEENKQNVNAISYWYPKIKHHFNTPSTEIIALPFETWNELIKEQCSVPNCSISDDQLSEWIKTELYKQSDGVILNNDIFIKSGSFSGKFNFENCYIKKGEFHTIGNKLKHIVYDCLLVDCEFIPEIAIRQFIHTSYKRPCIYNGLKLNTEFRAFVNFDMHEVMDIINYWDYDTMINGLWDKQDLQTFKTVGKEIENHFNELKDDLHKLLNTKLKSSPYIDMDNIWSVDFLWDGQDFILIDMATAQTSAYYERVYPNWKDRLEKFYHVKE